MVVAKKQQQSRTAPPLYSDDGAQENTSLPSPGKTPDVWSHGECPVIPISATLLSKIWRDPCSRGKGHWWNHLNCPRTLETFVVKGIGTAAWTVLVLFSCISVIPAEVSDSSLLDRPWGNQLSSFLLLSWSEWEGREEDSALKEASMHYRWSERTSFSWSCWFKELYIYIFFFSFFKEQVVFVLQKTPWMPLCYLILCQKKAFFPWHKCTCPWLQLCKASWAVCKCTSYCIWNSLVLLLIMTRVQPKCWFFLWCSSSQRPLFRLFRCLMGLRQTVDLRWRS